MGAPIPTLPPAGITAAVFWSPSEFVDPAFPPAIAAERIDPLTGELTAIAAGQSPVVAALVNQLRILRGSGAAVQDDGHRFPDIRYVDETTPAKIEFELARILKPFINRGDLQVVNLQVQAGEDAEDLGAAFLVFRDLRSGAEVRLDRASDGTIAIGPVSP